MPERKKEEGVVSLSYYFGFPGLPHLRSNWVQSTPFIKMEPDLAPFLLKIQNLTGCSNFLLKRNTSCVMFFYFPV